MACHYEMSVYMMSCTVHNKRILSFIIVSVARIVLGNEDQWQQCMGNWGAFDPDAEDWKS